MPGTLELTRRIRSVKSTRKITRAMQLVSASKMRKAQLATLASRTYAKLASELIRSLGGSFDSEKGIDSALTKVYPKASKIGVILITTNRGQVGGFNNNLLKKVKQLEEEESASEKDYIVLGKKGRDAAIRLKKNIVAEFKKIDTTIPVEEIYPLVKMIAEKYASGHYKKIYLVYNHFASTLSQDPTAKVLLPFKPEQQSDEKESDYKTQALFEPSPKDVLEHLLPRILESQVYQAILESDASEHSARMVMMKNATESAGELIDDLTLTYNQIRQNKITTELSEITAGRISLEKTT